MIICMVCDVLGEANNGTSIAAMNLINSLRLKGHTVRVVCPDKARKGEPDYYIVPPLSLGPLSKYVQKNGVVIAKPSKKVLTKALDGADHIHIMMPFMLGRLAVRMARRRGLSVTAGFHCQAENFTSHIFMKNNRLANFLTYKSFYHLCYKYVDAVHYPTEFIRDVFEHYGGKTNGYIISNGVNKQFCPMKAERPKEFEDKKIILFTGRYSKEKSHKILIDAAKKSSYSDSIQLIFAGDGPLKKKLIKQSRGLKNRAVFRFFSREDLVKVINYSDLYVHPAEIEIEAIACLEAISCGLVPVISDSKRSATRYFARDEKNLFPCNDSKALALRIDYWFDHPEEKELCRLAYLKDNKKFDFDECMDQMEKMIIETHQNKRTAG